MAPIRGWASISRASRLRTSTCLAQCRLQWLSHGQRRTFTRSTTRLISKSSSDPFLENNLDKAILDSGQELRPGRSFPPEHHERVQKPQAGQRSKAGSLKDRLRKPKKTSKDDASANSHVKYILGNPRNKPMRTRFAPSPTGDMHLGSLKTALINQIVAKSTDGGAFILRIEDTDQSRQVENSQKTILRDLKWLGLQWSEGPDIGGPCGPYLQSERLHIYKPYVEKLLEQGHAYRCFCKSEDLEKQKQDAHEAGQSTKYPGTCRHVSTTESSDRAAKGEPHVVRFKGDQFGILKFKDAIKGPFEKAETEDDFVLWKTDGFPTYHLANVVDDHLMNITHVIRGDEWLVSTPKHLALYRALGWEAPTFGHLGLLFDKSGRKLSKRDRAGSVQALRDLGALPLGVANWLAAMDTGFKSGSIFTIQEMSEQLPPKILKSNNFVDTSGSHYRYSQKLALSRLVDEYWNKPETVLNRDEAEDALKRHWTVPMKAIVQATREGESSTFGFLKGSERRDSAAWKKDLTLVKPLQELAQREVWAGWTQSSFNYIAHVMGCISRRPRSMSRLSHDEAPWLFWRPPLNLQRLWIAESPVEVSDLSLLRKMYDPVNGYPHWEQYLTLKQQDNDTLQPPFEWVLQQAELTGADWHTALDLLHRQNRLFLTGGSPRSHPSRTLIQILGLEECRARLRDVEGLGKGLREGGDALAQTWREEGRALIKEVKNDEGTTSQNETGTEEAGKSSTE